MIFIQIASYRDKQLYSTIKQCIDMAKYPDQLRFGVCWQHGPDESLYDLVLDDRIKVVEYPYEQSKGACWARSITQQMYGGEEFTMQIDSHSRFVQDWDEQLINMWAGLNDPKAILTCYPPNYTPDTDPQTWYKTPQICNVYRFIHRYSVSRPADMPDLATRTTPRKGVFVAAGFIFGPASIIQDVPYDPQFYFTGEEIAITLRLFTHGYNIYHPHILILHHYYARPNDAKHWTDHQNWGEYDKVAHERLDSLLGHNDIDLGQYGLGTERTVEDFKNYSGIDYKNAIVHEYAEKGGEPPYEYDEEGWNNAKETYLEFLSWDPANIDTADDISFWAFIVEDQHGVAIHRHDVLIGDRPDIINKETNTLGFEFDHNPKKQIVTSLLIWPFSKSKGWLQNTKFPV